MNGFFYMKTVLSSHYRSTVEKTFIPATHTLTFYLCGFITVAFFSPKSSVFDGLFPIPQYLFSLPFW